MTFTGAFSEPQTASSGVMGSGSELGCGTRSNEVASSAGGDAAERVASAVPGAFSPDCVVTAQAAATESKPKKIETRAQRRMLMLAAS